MYILPVVIEMEGSDKFVVVAILGGYNPLVGLRSPRGLSRKRVGKEDQSC